MPVGRSAAACETAHPLNRSGREATLSTAEAPRPGNEARRCDSDDGAGLLRGCPGHYCQVRCSVEWIDLTQTKVLHILDGLRTRLDSTGWNGVSARRVTHDFLTVDIAH